MYSTLTGGTGDGESGNGSSLKLPSTILLDIEGTTTSIKFVKDTLFPYSREKMESFIRDTWAQEETQKSLQLVQELTVKDTEIGLLKKPLEKITPDDSCQQSLIASILEIIYPQIDYDRKTPGLKALQGQIWRKGYEEGVIKGHVYDDVPEAMKKWTEAGRKIYIYSSGSEAAQRLLFKYSSAKNQQDDYIDLTKYISGYFDLTTGGPKTEAASYQKILKKLEISSPSDVLFLTDIPKEANAAKCVGMQSVIMIRPGNSSLLSRDIVDLTTAHSFHQFTI